MGLKTYLSDAVNPILKRVNYQIIKREMLYDWQKNPVTQTGYNHSELPKGAKEYLQLNNPVLQDLQARYAVFNNEVTVPLVWTDNVKPDDVLYFRGENAYVWQRLGGLNMGTISYALTTYYVKSIDHLRLLELLEEDEFFGIFTFRFDNRLISRDLLDSIIEIYFLEKHLSLSTSKDMTILDIGAGYGRLAHRMLGALPNIQTYLCTDAVAISTFISSYYLRFRNMEGKAKVVPLDEIQSTLRNGSVNIAVNIHSFSECQISAIDWWLSLLEKSGVKYLMIVPNDAKLLITNDGKDFGKIIEKHGYRLMAKEPKYMDPGVHEYAMAPAYHYLFELH